MHPSDFVTPTSSLSTEAVGTSVTNHFGPAFSQDYILSKSQKKLLKYIKCVSYQTVKGNQPLFAVAKPRRRGDRDGED